MQLQQLFETRRNMEMGTGRHGFIIADAGEAGNFIMKSEIADILANTDDRVIVIDPFNNSGDFSLNEIIQLNGKRYNIAPNSDVRLDLLPKDSTIEEKQDLLFAIYESISGSSSSKTKHELARILDVVHTTNETPSVSDVISELNNSEEDFFELTTFLECFNVFQGPTNVTLNHRLTIFNIAPFFGRDVAVYPVLEHIKNMLQKEDNKKRTWIYFCDMDAIISDTRKGSEYEYVNNFWRRARMRNIVCTGKIRKIANPETLQTMICNSSCIYFMTPTSKDRRWFDLLDIEPEGIVQMAYSIVGSEVVKGSIASIKPNTLLL